MKKRFFLVVLVCLLCTPLTLWAMDGASSSSSSQSNSQSNSQSSSTSSSDSASSSSSNLDYTDNSVTESSSSSNVDYKDNSVTKSSSNVNYTDDSVTESSSSSGVTNKNSDVNNINITEEAPEGAQQFAPPAPARQPGFTEKPREKNKERVYGYTPIDSFLWGNNMIHKRNAIKMAGKLRPEHKLVHLQGPFPQTSKLRVFTEKEELMNYRVCPSAIIYIRAGDPNEVMAELLGFAAKTLMDQGANAILFLKGDAQQELTASSFGLGGGGASAFMSGNQLQGLTLDGGLGWSKGSATQTGKVWIQALGLYIKPNQKRVIRKASSRSSSSEERYKPIRRSPKRKSK